MQKHRNKKKFFEGPDQKSEERQYCGDIIQKSFVVFFLKKI